MQSGSIEFVFDQNVDYVFDETLQAQIKDNKIMLPTIAPDTTEIMQIKAKVKREIKSDSILFQVSISGSRDINNDNNTSTATTLIKELLPLEISSLCSDNPGAVRAWRIQNPNPVDIPVDLYVQDEFFKINKD